VRVAICAPVYKNGDFECSVEISGLGPEVDGIPEEDCNLDWRDQGWFGAITGYDSIQALEMAFKLVENKLKPMAPQLSWLGTPGEHGLPRFLSMMAPDYDLEFQKYLLEIIENEQVAYMAKRFGKK